MKTLSRITQNQIDETVDQMSKNIPLTHEQSFLLFNEINFLRAERKLDEMEFAEYKKEREAAPLPKPLFSKLLNGEKRFLKMLLQIRGTIDSHTMEKKNRNSLRHNAHALEHYIKTLKEKGYLYQDSKQNYHAIKI